MALLTISVILVILLICGIGYLFYKWVDNEMTDLFSDISTTICGYVDDDGKHHKNY